MNKLVSLLMLLFISNTYALTLGEWNALDAYEKYEVLYNEEVSYLELRKKDIEKITDSKILNDIKEGNRFILNNASDEAIYNDVDNMDMIVTIGEPGLFSLYIYKIQDQIIGYQFSFYQAGGATKDESSPEKTHYDTLEEAQAAGIDTNADVNWQLHSMVEIQDGKVKEINLDIWNEGGWSWSGW